MGTIFSVLSPAILISATQGISSAPLSDSHFDLHPDFELLELLSRHDQLGRLI